MRPTSTAPPTVDDRFALLRSSQFLRLELWMAVLATVTSVVLLATTADAPATSYVVIGAFATTVAAMAWCLRRLTVDNVVETVLLYAAVLWTSTIVVAPLIPFALPVMTFPMIVPLLVAGPLLDRRQLAPFAIVGAIAMGLVATLSLRFASTAIEDALSDSTEDLLVISVFALRAITISLAAWDANARRDATLLAAAEARAALQASRARLVEVGDEQRRALERDLHDGAQQRLVALAMRLRMVGSRHPEVGDDLEPLTDELQEALAELREIAHGIYPPLLERSGLDEAIRAASRRVPLSVTVDADIRHRYPRAVESAVYYACLEALQNAAKHGDDDTNVVIDLREGRSELVAEVADDGPGFAPVAGDAGRGLQNMADRLAAVGGDLDVDSAPGRGTRVRARLPATPVAE